MVQPRADRSAGPERRRGTSASRAHTRHPAVRFIRTPVRAGQLRPFLPSCPRVELLDLVLHGMSSLTLSVAACALMLGGAILGALLHRILPDHHLDAHTKDVVRLGAALLATISGLVLGLLVSSTSSSFSAQRAEVTLVASNMILLDQL